MLTCFYCNFEVEEGANFCGRCFRQVRCRECSNTLKPNAPICLVCGTTTNSPIITPQQPINEYLLEEAQTEKTFKRKVSAKLTNEAAGTILSLLGQGVTPAPNNFNRRVDVSRKPSETPLLEAKIPPHEEEANIEDPEIEDDQPEVQNNNPPALETSNISKFFSVAGGKVVPTITDYKGGSKKEQQVRATILFIHANELLLKEGVKIEQIRDALSARGIMDRNFSTYFVEVKSNYLYEVDGIYKLNSSGQERAVTALKDIMNGESKGWSKGDSRPRKPRRGKTDDALVSDWLSKAEDLRELNIASITNHKQLVIFAVWLLTKKMKVADAVHPLDVYSFVKRKFQTVGISSEQFSNAVAKEDHNNRYDKTEDGHMFLRPNGEKESEALMARLNIQTEN